MAIYKLTLDDEMDKDILDYIASFPRMRKSEIVRQAIREQMAREGQGMAQVHTPIPVVQKPPVVETVLLSNQEEKQNVKENRFKNVNASSVEDIFGKKEEPVDIII